MVYCCVGKVFLSPATDDGLSKFHRDANHVSVLLLILKPRLYPHLPTLKKTMAVAMEFKFRFIQFPSRWTIYRRKASARRAVMTCPLYLLHFLHLLLCRLCSHQHKGLGHSWQCNFCRPCGQMRAGVMPSSVKHSLHRLALRPCEHTLCLEADLETF